LILKIHSLAHSSRFDLKRQSLRLFEDGHPQQGQKDELQYEISSWSKKAEFSGKMDLSWSFVDFVKQYSSPEQVLSEL